MLTDIYLHLFPSKYFSRWLSFLKLQNISFINIVLKPSLGKNRICLTSWWLSKLIFWAKQERFAQTLRGSEVFEVEYPNTFWAVSDLIPPPFKTDLPRMAILHIYCLVIHLCFLSEMCLEGSSPRWFCVGPSCSIQTLFWIKDFLYRMYSYIAVWLAWVGEFFQTSEHSSGNSSSPIHLFRVRSHFLPGPQETPH